MDVDGDQSKILAASTGGLEVKRRIGLLSGIAFIISSIIGSGVFITPGGVLERSGSVGLSLVIWAACGGLSILGGLSYAELGTLIPKSGGEYAYYMEVLGSMHPFWGPLPAFLYSWISIFLTGPAGSAVGCLSCASYTIYPILSALGACLEKETEHSLLKITAILYLGVFIAFNYYSVEWTLRINNVLTSAKLIAMAIIVGCGIYQLYHGNTQYLTEGFQGSSTDFGSIATAFYYGLWSYGGWSSLNYIIEEVENPSVNLPRAIVIGTFVVTFCYLAVNVAYMSVLSPAVIIGSDAVAVEVGSSMLGPMAFVIPVAVVLSIFGVMLVGIFQSGRIIFASAREGHLMAFLSYLHVDTRIPCPALLLTGGLTIVLILSQDLAGLIEYFSFLVWIFFVLAMVMLLILRRTRPNAHRPYRVPTVIPIIVILVGSYLVVAPFISQPTLRYLYVLAGVLLGVVVYVLFVYYKVSFKFIDRIDRAIQLTLLVGQAAKPQD